MKEDWTKQMKQKLEGHQMTPPAGLWESISNEMQLQTESESAPVSAPAKTVSMRRWYWVAAAAILAIVGCFTVYQFDTKEPQLTANSQKVMAPKAEADKPAMPAEEPILLAQATNDHKVEKTMGTKCQPQPQFYEQQLPTGENLQEVTDNSLQEATNENAPDATDNHQQVSEDTKIIASQEKKQTYLPDVINPSETRSKSIDTDKWTIGLNGSNGLLMTSNNLGNTMGGQFLNSDANYAVNSDVDLGKNGGTIVTDYIKFGETSSFTNMYTLPDVVSKHKLPVRFGLSLQYQLSNRIALHSGINYTYLESEFITPITNSNNYIQKLRYLGIPVGASWNIWSTGNLNVYLAGTALLEKCIDAQVSDGDIDQRPWQFSLNAAAGAEYNITRQFGLYLEPALGYYFNDGTSLQHYYKEHPLAPSIQFGLRLHLK